jgi:hypothetical protein
MAGRQFASWAAFAAHLEQWAREVADVRVHGTTGEPPTERTRPTRCSPLAAARHSSRPRADPPGPGRLLCRGRRQAYSVPLRLVNESVVVEISGGRLRVLHAGSETAVHAERSGRRQRVLDRVTSKALPAPDHRLARRRPRPLREHAGRSGVDVTVRPAGPARSRARRRRGLAPCLADELAHRLAPYRTADGVRLPAAVHLVTAIAPG